MKTTTKTLAGHRLAAIEPTPEERAAYMAGFPYLEVGRIRYVGGEACFSLENIVKYLAGKLSVADADGVSLKLMAIDLRQHICFALGLLDADGRGSVNSELGAKNFINSTGKQILEKSFPAKDFADIDICGVFVMGCCE